MDLVVSTAEIDSQTFELGQARLRLRSDLRFTLQCSGEQEWYLVEDDTRGSYFRISVTEFAFLSLLDGRQTLDEAMARLASLPVAGDLAAQGVASLARWLVESGLAETSASTSKSRIRANQARELLQQQMQWLNPISFRMSLFNPDTLVKRTYHCFSHIAGWPTLLVWLGVCGFGRASAVDALGGFSPSTRRDFCGQRCCLARRDLVAVENRPRVCARIDVSALRRSRNSVRYSLAAANSITLRRCF